LEQDFKIIDLAKIKTNEGHMFPIYRDWDKDVHEDLVPEMVYVTTIEPGLKKDIIYHKKRKTFITSVQGKLLIEILSGNKIEKFYLSNENTDSNHKIAMINPKIAFRLINQGDKLAIVVNCPTHSWKPNSKEMIKFNNWEEFKKWKD
tara:strand:+ start:374 stop:814 length:441 start_codon:yes stop_codon:yes gene_type:complete